MINNKGGADILELRISVNNKMGLFDFLQSISNNQDNVATDQNTLQEYRHCTQCGAKILPAAKFCAHCGTPVPVLQTSSIKQEEQIQSNITSQVEIQTQTQPVQPPKTTQLQITQAIASKAQQSIKKSQPSIQNQSQNKERKAPDKPQVQNQPAATRAIDKNTRIVYAEKRTIEKDGKIVFKDLDKNTYYIDKETVENFDSALNKQKGWAWVEVTGNEASLIRKKSGQAARANLLVEATIFENTHKVGNEIYAPILTDTAEDYRLVSLGPTLYTTFQMKDVPECLKRDLFQKGDIYRFKISKIWRTENNGLRVDMSPISRGCIVNKKPKVDEKETQKKEDNTVKAESRIPEKSVKVEADTGKAPITYVSDYIYSDPNGKSKLIQAEKKEVSTVVAAYSKTNADINKTSNVQDIVSQKTDPAERKVSHSEAIDNQKTAEKTTVKQAEKGTVITNNTATNTTSTTNEDNRSGLIERMILVKYLGIAKDDINYKFIDVFGKYYHIYITRAKAYIDAEKVNTWHWLKQDDKKFSIISNKTDKESHSKAFGYEINLFRRNYKEGDIEVFQIGDIKEDHMQVFYSANCSGRVYEKDLPAGKKLSDYTSGDLYRFKISFATAPNRKDPTKEDIIVELTPIERFNKDEIKPRNIPTIPDNLIEECDMRSLSSLQSKIDDEVFWKNLENKVGGKVTEESLREYLNKQYQIQKGNNALDITVNANGIAIDIDLGIRNRHEAPQEAGINLKSGRKDGFYLSFIGAVDPGQLFEKKVYVEEWTSILNKLAEKALPEDWGKGNNILKGYLQHTFYKVWIDGEVVIEGDEAVFNTGLVDNSYDDIYCYLTKCNNPKNIYNRKWEIGFFACWGKGQDGKKLNRIFSRVPSLAKYIKDGQFQNLYLDISKFGTAEKLSVDYEHIIIDNLKRFPTELIQKELAGYKELMEMIDRGEPATKWRNYIIDNDDMVRTLKDVLESAVKLAIKNCKWNYKTAIPIYYARSNNISLLLPLKLIDKHNLNPRALPDVALVIERYPNGSYQGQTILTMDMAYKDARLICRPNSEWLAIPTEESDEDEE